jgi:hypothetical protein
MWMSAVLNSRAPTKAGRSLLGKWRVTSSPLRNRNPSSAKITSVDDGKHSNDKQRADQQNG